MARPSKSEVSAVNLRIQEGRNRNYNALMTAILGLRRGVKVHGDKFIALTDFDESSRVGVFSKYSEIDIDKDWFDVDDFGIATEDLVNQINIPDNLKPNLSAFYFLLDENLHVVAFESYSESKSLSGRTVEKFFRDVLRDPKIVELFGRVEVDLVKDYGEVERLLELPMLKFLELVIRLPNTDDLSGGLAEIIEKRLRSQNGEEYVEQIKSKDQDGLRPNERTKILAKVAAENGEVNARSIVNGVVTPHTTAENPLKMVTTYSTEDRTTRDVFLTLARRLFRKVSSAREEVRQSALED